MRFVTHNHIHEGFRTGYSPGRVRQKLLLIEAESALGFSFGVRVQTEMKIWYVKGMQLLKVVSSNKNVGFKGLT